jgi:cation diffusion facilitator CzcD-associated flavoprotein CzcO
MHSAAWDSSYDLTDKTVAVIGGGSSAVQIIPSIQPIVKKLGPFLRSPVWITAGFGAKYAAPGGVNFNCACRHLPTLKTLLAVAD